MDKPISNIKMRLYGMTINLETLYQIALLIEQQGDLAGDIRDLSIPLSLVALDVELYQVKL